MKLKRLFRIPIITQKLLITIIITGFLLSATIFFAGYIAFARQFRNEHDDGIRSVSAAARNTLNPDKFQQYLETKTPDAEYQAVNLILQDFVDKFDLNLLYVSSVKAPDYSHITYIYNPVKKGGKWKPFPLGHEEDYFEHDYNSTAKRVFEEGAVIVRHTLKTRSGSHITAMYPVYDSEGKVVAVIGAQKSIQQFVNSLHSYTKLVICVALAFAVLFGVLFCVLFNQNIMQPLMLITKETDHFASWGGKPSDSLMNIKNQDEIGILAHSVHQMEYDVCKNIEELTKVTAEKERIGTELNLATKIQLDALPAGYPAFPERRDFDLNATMSPAKEVGGDLYYYMLIGQDKLLLSVGDVSGKGVPAALFMMTAKTLIASYAENNLSPSEIFSKTNERLCEGNETNLFVTAWLGILDLKTGELKYVNAGHPQPVVYHQGKFAYLTEKPNFILGGMNGVPYKEHSLTLEKGDRLFVYTDGVTEATDKDNQLFGDNRLMDAISTTENLSAPDTLVKVREKIDEFVGDAEQFDDITMLQFIWKEV